MTHSAQSHSPPVPLQDVYLDELRIHAIELIRMGYQQVPSASFVAMEEDDITDELVLAMRTAKQNPNAPAWVDFYEVHEQRPQNVAGKRGKRRPKMDIEFERNQRGPRPRLGFEAKRLGHRHTVNDYLGEKGMAAFLVEYYPTTHGEAGMLGYVQEDSVAGWSSKLAAEVNGDRERHRFVDWIIPPDSATTSRELSFSSHHTTDTGNALRIVHLLLEFH